MRGRKPCPLDLVPCDFEMLQSISRSRCRPFFQVQHARAVLAVAEGEPIRSIACRLHYDPSTVWRLCRLYERRGIDPLLADQPRAGRPQQLSPLQRAQIVRLACMEPIAEGLHITHWTSADLARQAMRDNIVTTISDREVRRILQQVDLQPHRTRYWKTARLDEQFLPRAGAILWCYAHAEFLAKNGFWVVCVDEMPNLQVLERNPIRRAIPGFIERQEFEYTRRGTVNIVTFLVVHSGQMMAMCPPAKDAAHYIECLKHFRRRHRWLKGVFLIQDGDPSHTAARTADYFQQQQGWWRPRQTPVHASWLNEGELLNGAFGHRYLKRQSWNSRESFIGHVEAAWPEYNRLYAHPFEWTWSDWKMRRWYDNHVT